MAARTRPIRTIVACLIFPPKWKAVAWGHRCVFFPL